MSRCIRLILLVVLSCTCWFVPVSAQVSFELKTSPEVDFIFSSIADYKSGITRFNSLKLNVSTDRRWDLSVKSTTSDWAVVENYGSNGNIPALDILELRVRNASSTPLISDFFSITDNDQYLIGSSVTDIDVPCPNTGANEAGDYLTMPSCYEFFVDLRITPGIDPVNYLSSGLYRLEIVFTISEDL